jgi:hypothetical protein
MLEQQTGSPHVLIMKINRHIFYFAINKNAKPYDELFGLSIGRLYWGWYKSDGLCCGWLDDNEALTSFTNSWVIPKV